MTDTTSTGGKPSTNLPAPRTPLVGRGPELTQLEQLLEGPQRLVTITGPPGVGKTRLALEVGWRVLQGTAPPEVQLVSLAAVRSAVSLAEAVAQALALPLTEEHAGSPAVEQVTGALARRPPALLIFDNFEQLVPVAEQTVGRWLERCPRLRLLVTSRHALAVPGEQRIELTPLPADDALQLFMARARAVAPGFTVAPEHRQLVAEIVERLDRLPLAIELAAPRAALFAPETVHQRLDDRFTLLRTSGAQLDQRHVTLRETIDWSWSLLDQDQQRALCACALFAGSVSVEALEQCLASPVDILQLVQQLRERSLLAEAVTDAGAPVRGRFRLLESIRDYARDQLARRTDVDELRRRFAAFFCGRAEHWSAQAPGSDGARALEQLRGELDNLLAAWELSARDDADTALRLALAIGVARSLVGPHEAHLQLIEQAEALAARKLPDSVLHARVLYQRAAAHAVTGPRDAATDDLDRVVRIARDRGDAPLQAQAELLFGALLRDMGHFDRGRSHLEHAASIFTDLGQRNALGHTVGSLATLHRQQGRLDQARSCYERALALHREEHNRAAEATELAGLGHLDSAQGNQAAAVSWYEQALPLLEQVGDQRTRGLVLDRLAGLALQEGAADRAQPLLQQAEQCLAAVGDAIHGAIVQAHQAVALACKGEGQRAQDLMDRATAALKRQPDARLWTCAGTLAQCVQLGLARADAGRGADARALKRLRVAERDAHKVLRAAGRSADGSAGYEEYVTEANGLLARLLETLSADQPAERATAAPPADEQPPLRVGRGALWFRPPGGDVVSLKRAPVLVRLLAVLVAQHRRDPDVVLPPDELFARVWPGEQVASTTAANRLYVAVAKLRRMGLDGILIRRGGGYQLLPSLRCAAELNQG